MDYRAIFIVEKVRNGRKQFEFLITEYKNTPAAAKCAKPYNYLEFRNCHYSNREEAQRKAVEKVKAYNAKHSTVNISINYLHYK